MKLKDILNEDWSTWRAGTHLQRTASGGFIQASGLWRIGLWDDGYKHKDEMDFLKKIENAGEGGYSPDKDFGYQMRNRVKNLENAGFIVVKDNKFYITQRGIDWNEAFRASRRQNLIRSHIPAYAGGVTGIGK